MLELEIIAYDVWGNEEVYKYMLYTPTLTIEEAIIRNEKSMGLYHI